MTTLRDEGFVTINPPLPVFRPEGAHETVRGYVLSQQQQEKPAPSFFVVQLTAAYNGHEAGQLMAVEEVKSIRGLAHMLPKFAPTQAGSLAAEFAYEVVLEPYERNGVGWQHLIHARRVAGAGASPAIGTPPSFPMAAKAHSVSAVMPPAAKPPQTPPPQPPAPAAAPDTAADALAAGQPITTHSRDAQGVVTKVTIEPAAGAEAPAEPEPAAEAAAPSSPPAIDLESLLERAADFEEPADGDDNSG